MHPSTEGLAITQLWINTGGTKHRHAKHQQSPSKASSRYNHLSPPDSSATCAPPDVNKVAVSSVRGKSTSRSGFHDYSLAYLFP
ncbi:hypothetical protein E2C01_043038 [Portunus trituberculatus]|uniref:Uncharacterized protein n=1 Tax=Portunus trituberculatus TaxID=210409 RepID=A0A5B7FP64_PORTR|nr:hypothetical protein [Portunus trituberculatus]